jgi:hypothetical protein
LVEPRRFPLRNVVGAALDLPHPAIRKDSQRQGKQADRCKPP